MSEDTGSRRVARERKVPRVARTFRLPPALIARYEARAAKLGMDRTTFVVRAIEAALGDASARPVALPAATRPPAEPVNRADRFRAAQGRR